VVDLVRNITSIDMNINDNSEHASFSALRNQLEIRPVEWFSFVNDTYWDWGRGSFVQADFDAYINHGDKWAFGIGRRFARNQEDQYSTELSYKLNQKWRFKVFDRFDVDRGTLKEENYVLTRDLHEWEMDVMYNQFRGVGTDILLVFRLKAFPEMNLDFGNVGYNKPKAGSQSSIGE
jgi:hypothetical protein